MSIIYEMNILSLIYDCTIITKYTWKCYGIKIQKLFFWILEDADWTIRMQCSALFPHLIPPKRPRGVPVYARGVHERGDGGASGGDQRAVAHRHGDPPRTPLLPAASAIYPVRGGGAREPAGGAHAGTAFTQTAMARHWQSWLAPPPDLGPAGSGAHIPKDSFFPLLSHRGEKRKSLWAADFFFWKFGN